MPSSGKNDRDTLINRESIVNPVGTKRRTVFFLLLLLLFLLSPWLFFPSSTEVSTPWRGRVLRKSALRSKSSGAWTGSPTTQDVLLPSVSLSLYPWALSPPTGILSIRGKRHRQCRSRNNGTGRASMCELQDERMRRRDSTGKLIIPWDRVALRDRQRERKRGENVRES